MDPKQSNDSDSLKALDAEEAALLQEAMHIDPERPEDATIKDDTTGEQAAPSAEETAKKTTDATKKTTADKKAADDKAATDKASKENADKQPDDKAAEEEEKLTPYQKERRRLDNSWKKLDEEKAATRKERDQLAAERKQIEDTRAKAATAAQPKEKPKHNGFTADDYTAAAEDFRAEGKTEEAALAERQAKALRAQEAEQATAGDPTGTGEFITLPTGARITAAEQQAMQGEWQANLKKLGDENPELMKEGTPLRAEVAALLKAHPILNSHGSGIHYAVSVAKLKLAAAEVPTLQTRITELETENKRLTELTSLNPNGGGGEGRRDKPKPEDMPIDQAEEALREEAMAADARGGQ